jgi:predicted PurR-regulated permease PerM
VLWLVAQLWVIMLALIVAVFMARALMGPANWLRRRGARPAVAALGAMAGFGMVVVGVGSLIVPAVVDEFTDLGPTIAEATDDIERWLVEDSPFDINQGDLDQFRDQAGESVSRALRSSGGKVVDGLLAAVEVLTGLLLAAITTFFLLKDGDRFTNWLLTFMPERSQPTIARLGSRAWRTLGGYLKGGAILGVLEAAIIGLTLVIMGASLVLPVMVLTFSAAFIPFAGAILAGVVAVMVALATAGPGAALVVGIVAVVVQQLDNDFLAPLVYGKALELHPLAVLFGIAGGSALFGAVGAVLAVPVTAVVLNVIFEARTAEPEAAASP